jgi:hypothetical protein
VTGDSGVGDEGGFDIGVEFGDVHDYDHSEYWSIEVSSAKGRCQLFVSKNRSEVQRIYAGIVARIDIPSSSQGVRFGSESSGMEADALAIEPRPFNTSHSVIFPARYPDGQASCYSWKDYPEELWGSL